MYQSATVPLKRDPRFSIVIPTRNEVENIDRLMQRIVSSLAHEQSYEIIVVDDASEDGTQATVLQWLCRAPVRLIVRKGERGLAGAVMRGAQEARSDVIVVMDADLSHSPEAIRYLVAPILTGRSDVSIGSRHVKGGRIEGWPWHRHIISRVAALLAIPMADARDPMSGFFAAKRSLLLDLKPESSGYKILLDLLATHSADLRVSEHPICFVERTHGQSKLDRRVIGAYLRQLTSLSGINITGSQWLRYGLMGMLVLCADGALFATLLMLGIDLGDAQAYAYAIAAFGWLLLVERSLVPRVGERWQSRNIIWRGIRWFVVLLAAFFLRGGIVESCSLLFNTPVAVATMAGMLASWAVLLLSTALFIFVQPAKSSPAIRWRITALGVFAYVAVLRLVYIRAIDLIPEEAYYWNYAQHLDLSYLDHPPMIAWLIGGSTGLLGNTEFAVRLPAMICWGVTAVFVFALTRRIAGGTAAFLSLLLLSVLPFFFSFGMLATPDAPLTACWAACLYFLYRALADDRSAAWIAFGACLGLGMLSKYTIALMGPIALLSVLFRKEHWKWFRSPAPYLGALVACVLFTPVIVWNAKHEWVSFAFQGTRRWTEQPHFGLHELLGFMLILLSPVGLLAAAGAVFRARYWVVSLAPTARWMLLPAALAPLGVFCYFSLQHSPKLNWTGPLFLACIPIMAAAPGLTGRISSSRWRYLPWKTTVGFMLLIFGGSLHYLAFGLPGDRYIRGAQLPVAWEEFGRSVEALEDELERRYGVEPLVVGLDQYFIASELAFYRPRFCISNDPRNEVTSSQGLFGLQGLMYELWFRPEDQQGRLMILVAAKPESLREERVVRSFYALTPINALPVVKKNFHLMDYYYRVGFEYLPGTLRSDREVVIARDVDRFNEWPLATNALFLPEVKNTQPAVLPQE